MDLQFNNKYNSDGTFSVSFGDSFKQVYGNRLLANRFEQTMLTDKKAYQTTSGVEYDTYGGNMYNLTSRAVNVNDQSVLISILTVLVDETVKSIQLNTPDTTPDEERLDSAELSEVAVVGDMVVASVRVTPVKLDNSYIDTIDIPIVG